MEPVGIQDYFTLPERKLAEAPDWAHDWTGSLSHWNSRAPPEMPIWQYTTEALGQQEPYVAYYSQRSPVSPFINGASTLSSALPSPNLSVFPRDTRYPHLAAPGSYPQSQKGHESNESPRSSPPGITENIDTDELMEDEDSDTFSWDPKSTATISTPRTRPPHRRTQSINEISSKIAKRAHTVVEKNYRERLNDKIADLALYLFETSSESRSKPSKSLVMTRAKERLKQLEARNKSLEGEVVKLRQHIAILDHIVASKGESPPANPE